MTSTNSSTIQDAELEANSVLVTKWFWIGFLLGLIGVLIVYRRSPKASVALLAKYEEGERLIFERSYSESLKTREVKNTWIGFAVVCAFNLLFIAAFWGKAFTAFSA